jgi:subtilisin family serine protease
MRKTLLILLAGAAALDGCAGDETSSETAQSALSTTGARFQRAPIAGPIASKVLPRAVDQSSITVVAFLGGPSVADLQESSARKLTRAEKTAVKAQRLAEQAGPRASITAAGGRVLGSFQSALNGIKVRLPRTQVDALRRIPGVVDVKPVMTYTHENFVGVQRIQAPFAWAGVAGFRGEGVKVAILDTGIDYTHANFGGPGTTAAFDAAFAANTLPADPALFGPDAPKVKGGTDLVGDNYDAGGTGDALIPVPDPNPLDCNGHGSHVAGTVAGYGVLADGSTYHGPYDQLTHSTHAFRIGPGVAPGADLYSVRVFGCAGSTDVIAEALEWAVDNDMDVVNMSLGAAFGTADSADSVASDNAVKAGVNVVAAAGNDGDFRYILSSPGASSKAIAVAATEAPAFIRMANLALPAVTGDPARTAVALNANGGTFASGQTLTALVLRTGTSVSLGCDPAEYVAQGVAGKVVVVQRGVCARVARAVFAQKAGAAAVIMINNTTALPPFEGQITSNPDTGEQFVVTIPFFGVKGTATTAGSDGLALSLRNGASITFNEGTPVKTGTASFSSGGPRIGDSALKPDIAAPGVNIVSTLSGSGNESLTISGTSMATPHVAGTTALAVQAHPKWKPAAIKSAIINSGDPDGLADYATHRVGTGEINAASAAGTLAYAYADRDATTLNFGLEQFKADLSDSHQIHVRNDATSAVTFNVNVIRQAGSPHTVATSDRQITVPARSDRAIDVTINVPAATAGNSDDFRDVSGLITFTPTTATGNRGISLKVPYYLVPRVSSNVSTKLPKIKGPTLTAAATITNASSAISATADFYAWGLDSPNEQHGRIDLRAAGAQSIDIGGGDRIIVLAVNTFAAWSTPATQEFDVLIDTNGDGIPDFDVFSTDFGLLQGLARSGQIVAAIFDLNTGAVGADFLAVAPTDASTILLPVLASSIGITAANPRFTYSAQSFDLLSTDTDAFAAAAGFNAYSSSVTNALFVSVDPDTSVLVPITVNSIEFAQTPAQGLMVVTQDNKNGADEADLVKFKF